jgi:hypothetical protein
LRGISAKSHGIRCQIPAAPDALTGAPDALKIEWLKIEWLKIEWLKIE